MQVAGQGLHGGLKVRDAAGGKERMVVW